MVSCFRVHRRRTTLSKLALNLYTYGLVPCTLPLLLAALSVPALPLALVPLATLLLIPALLPGPTRLRALVSGLFCYLLIWALATFLAALASALHPTGFPVSRPFLTAGGSEPFVDTLTLADSLLFYCAASVPADLAAFLAAFLAAWE